MKLLANYVFSHRFFPCTLSLYTGSDPWEVVEGTEKGPAVVIAKMRVIISPINAWDIDIRTHHMARP